MTETRLDASQIKTLNPDDAAAHWLVLRDRGLTASEASRFTAWLSASEANAAAWRRAERLWESFDAEPDVLLDSMRKAALAARPAPTLQVRRGLMAASVAAAVVLAGWAGWAGWRGIATRDAERESRPVIAAVAPRPDIGTAVGERLSRSLPDGTQATLDSGSALQIAYTAPRRDVRLLRGQAFFSVAHDASCPFVVTAAGRTVTATGTAFNVRLGPEGVSVVLARGQVLVAQADGSGRVVRLSPGQQFQAAPGAPGTVSSVDVDQALAWRTGYLEFRDEPLAKAVAEINRYGGTPVIIGDAGLGSLRVTGRFRVGDPARFARALSEIYRLRAVAGPDGSVTLKRR